MGRRTTEFFIDRTHSSTQRRCLAIAFLLGYFLGLATLVLLLIANWNG